MMALFLSRAKSTQHTSRANPTARAPRRAGVGADSARERVGPPELVKDGPAYLRGGIGLERRPAVRVVGLDGLQEDTHAPRGDVVRAEGVRRSGRDPARDGPRERGMVGNEAIPEAPVGSKRALIGDSGSAAPLGGGGPVASTGARRKLLAGGEVAGQEAAGGRFGHCVGRPFLAACFRGSIRGPLLGESRSGLRDRRAP